MASQQACKHTFSIVFLIIASSIAPFASCLLVPSTPLDLVYHRGPLLIAGDGGPIKLHLTFYGDFSSLEKLTIKSFLSSLSDHTPSSSIAQKSSPSKAPPKSLRLSLKSASTELQKPLVRRPLAARHGFSSQFPRDFSRVPPPMLKRNGFSSQFLRDFSGEPSSKLIEGSGFYSKLIEGSGSSSQFPREPSSGFKESPTVAKWWSITQAYTDVRGNRVSQAVQIEHEASDNYSHGKLLSHSDIASLAKSSARGVSHAVDNNSTIHLIFTAADVGVQGFCMHACGQHAHTENDGELGKIVYAWVGNARMQCPGYCEWPFVRTQYGPDMEPLRAPNGASVDGMIINLAKVLVEAATNPFGDGYYVGRGSYGAGTGSVCTGAYGAGAYPGYPGRALEDPLTGASFNVMGLQHSKFLLPYIWNPLTLSCAVLP